MNVEHAISCMVALVVALVALAFGRDFYGKRSRRRVLEDGRASDLRALRSLRVGSRVLLVITAVFVGGLVALYLTTILELEIWGHILGYGWIWPWT